ncbi:hypothetical protein CVT26_009909 [Gymnopilus dilepis]|uniref:RING-type domain-containing protein n=1 Tax=Gymnopilus dilepis TaxID=231916 RepID=A0A409YC14_9AGAR|nr:hypothetical protein CVT26_009909 [Gymnopilus dilepis]
MSIVTSSHAAQGPSSRELLPRGVLHEYAQPYGSRPTWKFSLEDIFAVMETGTSELLETNSSISSSNQATYCGICGDELQAAQALIVPTCNHKFCLDCLRTYVLIKLDEQRYPMACRQSMQITRYDYISHNVISCPLPQCGYTWCRDCRKPIRPLDKSHHCTDKELDRLMQRKGWKHCPGVHFCYKCGQMIMNSAIGGELLGLAIAAHYAECTQYEHRLRCASRRREWDWQNVTTSFARNALRLSSKPRLRNVGTRFSVPKLQLIIVKEMTQDIIQQLDLNADQQQKLEELQLLAHSVTLDCPRCRQTMRIDREQYGAERVIVCPLPLCGHKWCKTCLKTLASSQENHRCKNNNIDRLMKKKGWKYCPGCQTPVQKESGCNHITVSLRFFDWPSLDANGAYHFCYRCGVLMIDTTNGGDVGTAVTEHYLNCRLFEKRLKCSIQ